MTARLLEMLLGAFGDKDVKAVSHGLPPGSVLLTDRRLVLAGTRCMAPVQGEMLRDAAAQLSADVVLIRHGSFPETLDEVRLDVAVRLDCAIALMSDMLLYHCAADGWWLVPEDRGPFAALRPNGLELTFEPPFLTHDQRSEGLTAAAARIVRAARGGRC
jgi:hypothetical protein